MTPAIWRPLPTPAPSPMKKPAPARHNVPGDPRGRSPPSPTTPRDPQACMPPRPRRPRAIRRSLAMLLRRPTRGVLKRALTLARWEDALVLGACVEHAFELQAAQLARRDQLRGQRFEQGVRRRRQRHRPAAPSAKRDITSCGRHAGAPGTTAAAPIAATGPSASANAQHAEHVCGAAAAAPLTIRTLLLRHLLGAGSPTPLRLSGRRRTRRRKCSRRPLRLRPRPLRPLPFHSNLAVRSKLGSALRPVRCFRTPTRRPCLGVCRSLFVLRGCEDSAAQRDAPHAIDGAQICAQRVGPASVAARSASSRVVPRRVQAAAAIAAVSPLAASGGLRRAASGAAAPPDQLCGSTAAASREQQHRQHFSSGQQRQRQRGGGGGSGAEAAAAGAKGGRGAAGGAAAGRPPAAGAASRRRRGRRGGWRAGVPELAPARQQSPGAARGRQPQAGKSGAPSASAPGGPGPIHRCSPRAQSVVLSAWGLWV